MKFYRRGFLKMILASSAAACLPIGLTSNELRFRVINYEIIKNPQTVGWRHRGVVERIDNPTCNQAYFVFDFPSRKVNQESWDRVGRFIIRYWHEKHGTPRNMKAKFEWEEKA